MPVFELEGVDRTGRSRQHTIEAVDREDAFGKAALEGTIVDAATVRQCSHRAASPILPYAQDARRGGVLAGIRRGLEGMSSGYKAVSAQRREPAPLVAVCHVCQGRMEKSSVSDVGLGGTLLAAILFIAGIFLFNMPLTVKVFGIFLLVCGAAIMLRQKPIWKCARCRTIVPRG